MCDAPAPSHSLSVQVVSFEPNVDITFENLYVTINLGQDSNRTNTRYGFNFPEWNQLFTFHTDDASASLVVSLWHEGIASENIRLATFSLPLLDVDASHLDSLELVQRPSTCTDQDAAPSIDRKIVMTSPSGSPLGHLRLILHVILATAPRETRGSLVRLPPPLRRPVMDLSPTNSFPYFSKETLLEAFQWASVFTDFEEGGSKSEHMYVLSTLGEMCDVVQPNQLSLQSTLQKAYVEVFRLSRSVQHHPHYSPVNFSGDPVAYAAWKGMEASKFPDRVRQLVVLGLPGTFLVRVMTGRNLPAMDAGSANPYCVVTVGSESDKKKKAEKTQCVKGSLNPMWDTTFTFTTQGAYPLLDVKVYHQTRFGEDKLMGQVSVSVECYASGDLHDLFLPLPTLPVSDGDADNSHSYIPTGASIRVQLQFNVHKPVMTSQPNVVDHHELYRALMFAVYKHHLEKKYPGPGASLVTLDDLPDAAVHLLHSYCTLYGILTPYQRIVNADVLLTVGEGSCVSVAELDRCWSSLSDLQQVNISIAAFLTESEKEMCKALQERLVMLVCLYLREYSLRGIHLPSLLKLYHRLPVVDAHAASVLETRLAAMLLEGADCALDTMRQPSICARESEPSAASGELLDWVMRLASYLQGVAETHFATFDSEEYRELGALIFSHYYKELRDRLMEYFGRQSEDTEIDESLFDVYHCMLAVHASVYSHVPTSSPLRSMLLDLGSTFAPSVCLRVDGFVHQLLAFQAKATKEDAANGWTPVLSSSASPSFSAHELCALMNQAFSAIPMAPPVLLHRLVQACVQMLPHYAQKIVRDCVLQFYEEEMAAAGSSVAASMQLQLGFQLEMCTRLNNLEVTRVHIDSLSLRVVTCSIDMDDPDLAMSHRLAEERIAAASLYVKNITNQLIEKLLEKVQTSFVAVVVEMLLDEDCADTRSWTVDSLMKDSESGSTLGDCDSTSGSTWGGESRRRQSRSNSSVYVADMETRLDTVWHFLDQELQNLSNLLLPNVFHRFLRELWELLLQDFEGILFPLSHSPFRKHSRRRRLSSSKFSFILVALQEEFAGYFGQGMSPEYVTASLSRLRLLVALNAMSDEELSDALDAAVTEGSQDVREIVRVMAARVGATNETVEKCDRISLSQQFKISQDEQPISVVPCRNSTLLSGALIVTSSHLLFDTHLFSNRHNKLVVDIADITGMTPRKDLGHCLDNCLQFYLKNGQILYFADLPQRDELSALITSLAEKQGHVITMGEAKDGKLWYREHFALPADEVLLKLFHCMLGDSLVLGCLGVFNDYVCFYANTNGVVTNITLQFKDVRSIELSSTGAGVFAISNAVTVVTANDSLNLTGFRHRERAHKFLINCWKASELPREEVRVFYESAESVTVKLSEAVTVERLSDILLRHMRLSASETYDLVALTPGKETVLEQSERPVVVVRKWNKSPSTQRRLLFRQRPSQVTLSPMKMSSECSDSKTTMSNIGSFTPVWVRDSERLSCQTCGEAFTLLRRRHHCRRCGGLFCAECCDTDVELSESYGSKQLSRVCDDCLQSLEIDHAGQPEPAFVRRPHSVVGSFIRPFRCGSKFPN